MTSRQQAADPRRALAAAGTRRGGTLGAVAVLAVIAATSFATRGVAGATPQSFSVSPSSGPPGTVVEVSGTGCSPGVTVTPAQDYVKVTSTILGLSTDIPVAVDGSWHRFFTVPSNATGAGLVHAVCFTDGLASLTTTYLPQGFIVTGKPLTTTTTRTTVPTTPTTARQTTVTPRPPNPGATPPGGTPTTQPTNGSTPGSPGGGGTPGAGTPGGGGPGGSGISGSTGSTSGGSTSGAIGGPYGSKAGPTANAAGLREPRLASSTSGRSENGSLWVLWLLLIALAAGALALLWWWQHREPGESDPASDVT
jgi:hypothetical protein